MKLPIQYPYNPNWEMMAVCGAFFGLCSYVLAFHAAHNQAGVVIEGIIRLGTEGATILYWLLSAFSAVFVVLALLLIRRTFANPKGIELTADSLILPHGFMQRNLSHIHYRDIQAVTEVKLRGQTLLYVYSGGRKFTITASLFSDQPSYVAVRDFISTSASNHKSPPVKLG